MSPSLAKLRGLFKKRTTKPVVEKRPLEVEEAVRAAIPLVEPIQVTPRDPSWRVIESYYVYRPFVKITISETPEGPVYFVEEYGLTIEDKLVLDKLTQILMDEIRPPSKPEEIKDLRSYVFEEAKRIAEKYRNKLGLVGTRRLKLLYYIERNLIGYGAIDPLMRDPNIEDISCNGTNVPIYVWHRKYESIPTNITFLDDEYLNEFVMKLAHMAGKHISIAFPIVDAMLPGKHRLAATFGREVSVKGPTFTIRKFRERPFSPVELIMSGTLNSLMAAYLWTLVEHAKTAMIAGGTGAGKSFPGDTYIIARVNSVPRILTARELYDMVNSREYRVGDHIVKDVREESIEVLSLGRDYKLKWKKLLRVIKHRDHRPLVMVRTNSSITITTQDHNFIKIDPETLELVGVEASELRKGDHIVNVWLDIDYSSLDRVEPDYAYLIGLWIGDGHLDENSMAIGFSNSNIDIIDKYRSLVERYWSKNTYIYRDKRNSVAYVVFRNNSVFNKLRKLYTTKKTHTIRIPSEIVFGSNEVICSFLAGYIDSDGSIYFKKKDSMERVIIELGSRSPYLINGLSLILKRLRIQHHLKVRSVGGEPYYRILVYDLSAVKLIKILYKYSIKARHLMSVVNKICYTGHNPNTNVYPIGRYLEKIRRRLRLGRKTVEKELGLSSRYVRQYEYGRRSISLENLRRFYEYYLTRSNGDREARVLLDRLKLLLNGDLLIEKVLEIRSVDATNDYLYDLEVEDTHLFVIGLVGWRLNHNTSLLNAISLFIKPGMKIVSVEDTPELNLPHPNWVQLTTRESYIVGGSSGTEIGLFDLVKLSLRYRPDYIIVGEIRGKEAFVLFQAMAVGHGGLSTLHAETLDYAIKRLTSPPMNIPPTYMKLMNIFIHINRVITRIEKGIVRVQRRINILQEVEDHNKYITIAEWDPRTDQHKVYLERSIHLKDIAAKRGLDIEDVIEEIYRKATVLNWMIYRNITNVWDVSRIIFNYYYDPASVYRKAIEELQEMGRETEEFMAPRPAVVAPTETLSVGETERMISSTEVTEEATRELFGRTRELRRH